MPVARVHRISATAPDDVSGIEAAIANGTMAPEGILAIFGKTEGNGLVNDFSRGFAVQSLRLMLERHLDTDSAAAVCTVMSGGTEGGMAPHWLVLERHEGEGMPGPALAIGRAHTPDLLKEAGYRYIMDWSADDQPFWMRTRSGPLLSIPYHIEINDSPAQLTRRHTADDFTRMVTGHFDEQIRQSENQPLVFSLALHTFVVGQPYRLAGLRDILMHMVEHEEADRVWFCRPRDIYEHVAALPPGTVPGS